jgi:hypothetical protein
MLRNFCAGSCWKLIKVCGNFADCQEISSKYRRTFYENPEIFQLYMLNSFNFRCMFIYFSNTHILIFFFQFPPSCRHLVQHQLPCRRGRWPRAAGPTRVAGLRTSCLRVPNMAFQTVRSCWGVSRGTSYKMWKEASGQITEKIPRMVAIS